MIVFDLCCPENHTFEAWFKDSATYEKQLKEGLIQCPYCGSSEIRKALSPVAIRRSSRRGGEGESAQEVLVQLLAKAYEYIEKNSVDVGTDFAKEALKIHYGVREPENIRGVATEEEEKMLKEEGVKFIKLPVLKRKGSSN